MDIRKENTEINKRSHSKIAEDAFDKKIFSNGVKDDGLSLLFQNADEVFNGWVFFEDEQYEGLFIEGK